jgi:hypothetical protein
MNFVRTVSTTNYRTVAAYTVKGRKDWGHQSRKGQGFMLRAVAVAQRPPQASFQLNFF